MKLKCFDRIRVRDLKIKRRSISVEYVLEMDGISKSYRLIESYGEDINTIRGIDEIGVLISIIPVINYSLFTREIDIDLSLNIHDYKFLLDSIWISAGEILINRVLNDTGLIKREEIQIDEYVNRRFIEENLSEMDVREIYDGTDIDYEGDPGKGLVLMGGGKDSLLSFGVLNEVGIEVYPFYMNEAGRHWTTALKSYRYFKVHIGNTIKVWSNVDRLFSFIEKNMWIIREKYWTINRDIYPIRLFWYPHYILSSIPIAMKRDIGNISMGNEYDDPTGLTYTYNNIRHFYGTYDQSQIFDKYMTEWFQLRGFKIYQWSPIRPLSGLIVERILYNRYPELFRLQVSCHSAHIENGEIYPCGKCRKCIGIKIFLLANRIDPTLLGYKPTSCRELKYDMKNNRPNLDISELEHSLYLINKYHGCQLSPAREHWYIETIRFDPINSHPDNIPYEDIRDNLLEIFEEYTDGYSILSDGIWRMVDKRDIFNL